LLDRTVLPVAGSQRTKGDFLLATLRARIPPYELPDDLIEDCVALCNRMTPYNAAWKFIYRSTTSGATVEGPEVKGNYISSNHQPFNTDCKCNQCVNGQSDIQMKAKADRNLEPTPREIQIRELNELISWYEGQVEEMRAVMAPHQRYVSKRLPPDQVFHMLRTWEKQDKMGFMDERSKMTMMKMYHQSLNLSWEDRIVYDTIKVEELLKRRNKVMNMEGVALRDKLYERQKQSYEVFQQVLKDPPPFEVMKNQIIQAVTNFRLTPKETWEYHIGQYLVKLEELAKQVVVLEQTPEPSVHAPEGFEEPAVILPQSREISQVLRRIAQSPMNEAEYYFGVHDDGTLVRPDRKQAVLDYFLRFYQELLDEGFRHNELRFLTGTEFRDLQKTFRSFSESEEGWVEYKSTGSHNTSPIVMEVELPRKWRVIQLTIRKTATSLKIIPHVDEVKEFVWGTRPLSMTEKDIRMPTEICRVSRFRPACFLTPQWKEMTNLEREKARAEDNRLTSSAAALGKTLTAITEALILSRQYNKDRPLRELNLGKEEDLILYRLINNIQKEVIKDWGIDGHDKTCDEIKKSSAELRVIWQTGKTVSQVSHKYTEMFVEYLHYLHPIHNHKEVTVVVNGKAFYPNAYGLCVMGTLSRALPPPSTQRSWESTLDTYERFKHPTIIPKDKLDLVTNWTTQFYKNMRPPVNQQPEFPGVGACLERSRREGGIGSLISQFYHLLKKNPHHPSFPNTEKWWATWKDLLALKEGNVVKHQQKSAEFAYALSLDICTEKLLHFKTCIGRECKEKMKHFPLLPITIPEQGHKTRVPCLGSGFFNVIQQPIRKSLFEIIERDNRCAYRTKGGTNRSKLAKFLENFEKAMLIHSGDLTVSTDNFSLEFNWAVAEGLKRTGKITETEYLILKAATGPFRMIEPGEEADAKRTDLLIPEFWEIKPKEEMIISNTAKKMWDKMNAQQDKRKIPIPGKTIKIIPQGKARSICTRCQTSTDTPRCMVHTTNPHPKPGATLDELILSTEYPEHIFPKVIISTTLEGFRKETNMKEKEAPLTNDQETKGEGVSFPLKKFPKETFPEQIDAMLVQIRRNHDMCEDTSYLTQKGMQMSQALSITMLYTLNIFADDRARKVGKGMSLLCGDDSLRAGNELYINKYREEISALGGIWSKTKDVVGSMGHGIFTEQHFSDGKIYDIPKVKVACKTNPKIAGWKTIIQSVNNAEMPEIPKIISAIKEEMLYPYRDDLNFLKEFLPIGIDTNLGGLGPQEGLPWVTEEILSSIQELRDISKANDYMMKVTKCLHIDAIPRSTRRKINLMATFPEGPTVNNTVGFHTNTHRWLYLEKRRLRSALEATTTLEDPAIPPLLRKESLEQTVKDHISRMAKLKNRLIHEGVFPPVGILDRKKLQALYHHDVPTNIVKNIIGTLVITPRGYQLP